MSSSSEIKVLIDSKQLTAYRINVNDDGKRVKEQVFDHKLEKNNLPKVLSDLQAKLQVDHVSLYLTDDLVLTNIIEDESDSAMDRDGIGLLVKTKLAIDLDAAVWDYTKINNRYQIVCLPGDYVSYIAPAFNAVGIKIDAIEPVSISLAKLLANQSEPVMLVYDDVERLVVVCWQGLVFEPTLFIPVELSNKAKKLKQHFSHTFAKDINQAVASANFADPYIADLTALSLNTDVIALDPFTGVEIITPAPQKKEEPETVAVGDVEAAGKVEGETPSEAAKAIVDNKPESPEDYRAIWQEKARKEEVVVEPVDDKTVIDVTAQKETAVNIQVNRDDTFRPKRNLAWVAIAIPLLITFLAVGYLLTNSNRGDMFNPLIESSTGNSTASSSAIIATDTDKAKLTIQVLNGNGKAGEAAKVKGLLEATGFTVKAVGNATSSSAIKTEIKSKVALTDAVKKDFQDALSKLYDTQFTVGTVAVFDVVVTVGKSK